MDSKTIIFIDKISKFSLELREFRRLATDDTIDVLVIASKFKDISFNRSIFRSQGFNIILKVVDSSVVKVSSSVIFSFIKGLNIEIR